MVKIYLVRHGEATEGWTSQDPPLSELGKSQAQSLATFVSSTIDENSINNIDFISSPLNRCKETASFALEKMYSEIVINNNFRELPSPTLDLKKRVNWLRRILPLTWPELLKDKETIEILKTMKEDEDLHARQAVDKGSEELKIPVKKIMQFTAKMMTSTSKYI